MNIILLRRGILPVAFIIVITGLFFSMRHIAIPFHALYRDASLTIDVRVEDLLSRMTTNEKIGQLALVEKNSITDTSDISSYGIGALLSGGGGNPIQNTPKTWLAMVNDFQHAAQNSRLSIPLLYGVDAIHGHSNVLGATIFPHALGLGATKDTDLVRRIGEITAQEISATGVNWNFSPTVDVVDDTRWGRTYETFSSNPIIVSELSVAYLTGLQSEFVMGTAKHYLGTGAMAWGSSTNPDFKIDQGATLLDETTMRATHLPPFAAAIDAGVNSIMVGHISWNGVELSANHYLLTDVLKNELGFDGFVVSDWNGVDEISSDKYLAMVTAINAGVDMIMLPFDYKTFTTHMKRALDSGAISRERLDDATRRILRAKFSTGLFDTEPVEDEELLTIGSPKHRTVAREAVRKSMVLLKDVNTLPLNKNFSHIVVAGSSANNLGRQSGGWTIEWQGVDGNWIPGTTILDGIKNAVSENTKIEYSDTGFFSARNERADIGIVIVGEAPYAEGAGDNEHPELSTEDLQIIKNVKAISKKTVIIIVSGRPLDIRPYVDSWDAVIAAWLPGSEGNGIADVLFGDYLFTGTLPVNWPL
ncbi:TPA: beta-glucosidase [Candidatus Uhrbacteria bacterium]|nr:MAG: glycoside hydrolase family protein, beta-glucosidase [Candidatus Peregrinibacteria bacterium GW2011_GWC2_39_14]HBP00230.1 beta-glucosidase [Candidatus Uhrbacteria bacterium]